MGRWGATAWFQAGHLSLVVSIFFFFFFLGRVSRSLNGGSDLSVLTDRSPMCGKIPQPKTRRIHMLIAADK